LTQISAEQTQTQAKVIDALDVWVAQADDIGDRDDRSHVKTALLARGAQFTENETLRVEGDLDLNHCRALTSLPGNLSISGDLHLGFCKNLIALPSELSVGGNLELGFCKSLMDMPDTLTVGGSLDLGNAAVRALPQNLTVGDSLVLCNCENLTTLPDNFSINGTLNLISCTSLTSLPENLTVGDALMLCDCKALTSLPNNLSVNGSINLHGCTGLTSLSDNFRVGGNLHASFCTSLTNLPDILRVGRNVSFNDCTSLSALPDRLEVGGNLNCSDCTSLTRLPTTISISGHLNFMGCTALTALPNWIATLGPIINSDEPRIVDLTNTGLSEAVLNNLSAAQPDGLQIIFGHAAAEYQQYQSLDEVIQSWQVEAVIDHEQWALTAPQHADVTTFLSRLHNTAEAANPNTRPNVQNRINDFLEQMQCNTNAYRSQALALISDSLHSCDDRVILTLNNIEILSRIRQATTSATPKTNLKALGTALLALEVVHRHAAQKCVNSSFVDPIEVYLAFEIELASDLNLPVSTENMLFAGCANLTTTDIANAKVEAQSTIETPVKVDNYLAQWTPWQQLERAEQLTDCSWQDLSVAEQRFLPTDTCVISGLSLDELTDPVCLSGNLYSFTALATWWGEHGNDPATTKPVLLTEIQQVAKHDATNHLSSNLNLT